MDIDELVDFTYSRNPLWQKLFKREVLRRFFERNRKNTIEVRIDGELVGVGFYWRGKDELHFFSATIREDVNGVPIMLRAIKNKIKETGVKFVSWYNQKHQFKRWRVNEWDKI